MIFNRSYKKYVVSTFHLFIMQNIKKQQLIINYIFSLLFILFLKCVLHTTSVTI